MDFYTFFESQLYNRLDNHNAITHTMDLYIDYNSDETEYIGIFILKEIGKKNGYITIWRAGEISGIELKEERLNFSDISSLEIYYDERDEYFTRDGLKVEYARLFADGEIEENKSFSEWLENITDKNGTVTKIYG